MDGWAGENWLDVKNQQVRDIMTARVKTAAGKNCDAIEPDNMTVGFLCVGESIPSRISPTRLPRFAYLYRDRLFCCAAVSFCCILYIVASSPMGADNTFLSVPIDAVQILL